MKVIDYMFFSSIAFIFYSICRYFEWRYSSPTAPNVSRNKSEFDNNGQLVTGKRPWRISHCLRKSSGRSFAAISDIIKKPPEISQGRQYARGCFFTHACTLLSAFLSYIFTSYQGEVLLIFRDLSSKTDMSHLGNHLPEDYSKYLRKKLIVCCYVHLRLSNTRLDYLWAQDGRQLI